MHFTEALTNGILILDGGMGTLIQRQGIKSVDNEQLNLTHPDAILKIHKAYIDAGADIIETNSFGANRLVQKDFCLGEQAAEMAFQAACIARKAADEASRNVYVAGSVGPTGKSLSFVSKADDPAWRECDFDEFKEACKEQISALVRGGVDLILLETCYDALNTKAAICALQELGSTLPVIISVTVSDRSGRTLTGQSIEAFYTSVRHCPNLVAFGINCALGAREMVPMVKEIASFSDLPVIFYPNAGLPDRMGQYCDDPLSMASVMESLTEEGIVNIIGGCCGTTPEHIRAISRCRSAHSLERPGARHSKKTEYPCEDCLSTDVTGGCEESSCSLEADPRHIRTSSAASGFFECSSPRDAGAPGSVRSEDGRLTVCGLECVTIDKARNFTNIGERTNVAGSKKFARLIAENNYAEALKVATDQISSGAEIIDVNMDDPMVDSTVKMREFLRHISGEPEIAKAAIMIDSSHWETILEGLKNAQGRCIVNSISLKEGEDEFLRKARVIRSFGAAMVVMAFDEQGQAVTYERKVEICRRSYQLLTTNADIPPQDIIFDCNILSIGTGIAEHDRFGVDFIEAVRWIKRNLPGAKASGGLSNLSFAFRGNNRVREAMHSAFLYHAIGAGLDMAIVNPGLLQIYDDIDPKLRTAVEDVIFNSDPQATSRLVQITAALAADDTAKSDSLSLSVPADQLAPEEKIVRAVVRGDSSTLAKDIAEILSKGREPLTLIEGELMQGMEKVGKHFAEGKMFLPQVVKSARIMQDAVALIKPHMNDDQALENKPKFLIATVQGDVHDIGKNIVAILLRCSGFEVIDMGVMVPCIDVIEKAIAEKVDIIGLSGLITPSLHFMEEICKSLAERGMKIPLIVGGAATSQLHTAVKLSAIYDHVIYGGNASDTVVIAKKILSDPLTCFSHIRAEQSKISALYLNSEAPVSDPVSPSEMIAPSTFEDIPITELNVSDLKELFDWNLYRAVCNIKSSGIGELLEGKCWLEKCNYSIRLCARFFNCRRDGDDLVLDSTDSAGNTRRIPFLHASTSLLDLFAEGKPTQIGTFAVRLEGNKEDDLVKHAVMATLAEAGAEWVRRSLAAALPRGMKLITPGIGYSCIPDHTLKRDVLSLLSQEMGIELTSTCSMIPEASICGLIIAGKEVEYRDPKGVSTADVDDYARRRTMNQEEKSIFKAICSTFTR